MQLDAHKPQRTQAFRWVSSLLSFVFEMMARALAFCSFVILFVILNRFFRRPCSTPAVEKAQMIPGKEKVKHVFDFAQGHPHEKKCHYNIIRCPEL